MSTCRVAGLVGLTSFLVNALPPSPPAREVELTIKNHRFYPQTLKVPTGETIKLVVSNHDSTSEEFESYTLNRARLIPGNSEGIVLIGPLEAGVYDFFGERNRTTARGKIIAAEKAPSYDE